MTPGDSLSILTTLSGVVVILVLAALALVTWMISRDQPSSALPNTSRDLLAEPPVHVGGLVMLVGVLLVALLATAQIIHWALP
jgi:hypothetical protein